MEREHKGTRIVLHLPPELEALARRIADARHLSVEQAIKIAVEASARIAAEPPPKEQLSRDELIRRMEEISARSATRPIVDPRSPDELLGYDEFGLPR
jgi:antitoxin VapB